MDSFLYQLHVHVPDNVVVLGWKDPPTLANLEDLLAILAVMVERSQLRDPGRGTGGKDV